MSESERKDWPGSVYSMMAGNFLGIQEMLDAAAKREELWKEITDMPTASLKKEKVDMVNKPPHYEFAFGLEVIDVIDKAIEKNMLDPVDAYNYGQVLKYLLRCGCKGNMLQDLRKSQFYLNRLIDIIEEETKHNDI